MKTGSHSMVMEFLIPYANKTILYARYTLWPHVALAVGRLDTLMCLITPVLIYWLFLWSPFTAPWHRSLARAWPGRLPGTCLASLCARLPGLPARTWLELLLLPALLSAQPPFGSAQANPRALALFMMRDWFFRRYWALSCSPCFQMTGFFVLQTTVISVYVHSPEVPEFVRGQLGNLWSFEYIGYNQDPKSLNHFHTSLWQCYLLHLVSSSARLRSISTK